MEKIESSRCHTISYFPIANAVLAWLRIVPCASSCGCVNRTSHPCGSSGILKRLSALAATPPQKHLGTVLCPS